MSFSELLEELPRLTLDQRQLLVRKALEFDDPGFSAEDEALVEKRLAAHGANPESSVPLAEMKVRLGSHHS
jgi:hypothetical protein